jgi:hypothetical protein
MSQENGTGILGTGLLFDSQFFFHSNVCGIKVESFMLRRRRTRHRPAAAPAAALHASFEVLQA